ncbi:DUF2383 domain-containing protein [Gymnodinialimonas sp.]
MATPAAPITPVTPMESTDTSVDAEIIQKPLTRTVDALAGYEKMVAEAEPEVLAILQKLQATHKEHAAQLAAIIVAAGGTPDTDGSLMSTVNTAVVSLRAMFDEIDDDALEHAIDGEKYVVEAFEDAMKELPEGENRQALADMLAQLEGVLAEARVIAD